MDAALGGGEDYQRAAERLRRDANLDPLVHCAVLDALTERAQAERDRAREAAHGSPTGR